MDISFLRLIKNDFELAKQVDDIYIDGEFINPLIQMLPNETFLQITNLPNDIAFAGFIKVELVDCFENLLQDITSNFYLNEFTNTVSGIKQIAFEFGNIGVDYYNKHCFLKITNSISNDIWYSNAFFITELNKEKTTKIWYKNENYFEGVSYDIQPYFQSIRLSCFKFDDNFKQKRSEYIQLKGNEISLRVINTYSDKYKFDWCNYFTSRRLMRVLNHDEIYIDNFKVSNKPIITKGDRINTSNFFDFSFEANVTEDYLNIGYQIYQPLQIIATNPIINNSYNLSTISLNPTISIDFNKNIFLNDNTKKISLFKDNTLFRTYTNLDYVINSNNLLITDSSGWIIDKGTYSIKIELDLLKAISSNEDFEINNFTDYLFFVTDGFFNKIYFNPIYFNTNL